jgi:WD40 repeat protein
MRLLKLGSRGELSMTTNLFKDLPPYAILSHTWGADDEEVTFRDLENGLGKSKAGYDKILFCGEQAKKDGLVYFWVDTCCIDKSSSSELSEAITSMFGWYHDARRCYVYLSDVSARKRDNDGQAQWTWESAFRNSRWFNRGWTLQELLAPNSVEFFSRERERLGNKNELAVQIHEITTIPLTALRGDHLTNFSVFERLRWAEKRETKRQEDMAYCLLGIFDISMSLRYGEGDKAFSRFKQNIEEPLKSLNDLQATDPGLDMERIQDSKDPLLKDCYEWILKDPILQEWQDGDTSPLLWIKGDPGKGKTMLMIALVRELSNSMPRKLGAVTFFFCQSTDPRLNNAASILRGLIWKLAQDYPQLARLFHENHERKKHMFNGQNAVYALFSTLSAMLAARPGTVLVIDALDECTPGPERDQLLQLITKHAKLSTNAKWLLASRNYSNIRQLLEEKSQLLSLELNEQHISKAVHAFIEQKTNELAMKKKYDLDLAEEVKKRLIAKANSTFLWVSLACKSLVKVSRRKTLSTLENLPPGLGDLYARMMQLVLQGEDEEDRNFCLQILRSVSLAIRPLSIEELIIVAQLPKEFLDDSVSDLVELCGSFIVIRERILYFVHQSAKDYLVGDGALRLFSSSPKSEHGLIVDRSLNAMSSTLKRDMGKLGNPGSTPDDAKINAHLKAISYVCSFWVNHLASFLSDGSINNSHYREYLSDRGHVHQFLLKHLLHWFEALSLLGHVDSAIMGLHSLEQMSGGLTKLSADTDHNYQSFVHDAIRVLRKFRPAIEEAPLQVYCSALIFSPENSIVRQNFELETSSWISTFPGIPKDWSPCLQTLEGHTGGISSVVYSPDSRQLASGSDDGTVRLWDAATGACLQTLKGHTDEISSVVYSPDSRQLASGSDDCTVRLWDAVTGSCLQTLESHTGAVELVVYSSDSRQLASGADDGTVRLWDAVTGTCLQTLEGYKGGIGSVVYSPDSRQLASGSDDSAVRLWDVVTGICLQTLEGHTDMISSVVYSPDSQRLASGSDDSTVRLWDAATGACLQTLKGHTDKISSVIYSLDSRQLASGSYDSTVRLWDAVTGTCMQTLKGHTGRISLVVYSPDSRQLASGSYDCTVRLWDAATGTCLQTLECHTDMISSVVYSLDSRQLASGSYDGTVRLWDAVTGAYLQTLECHTDMIGLVVYSPDSRQLASGSDDCTVRLWDAVTGTCLQTLEGHTGAVELVVYSSDSRQLASGSDDGTVRLWDAVTGTCLQTLEGYKGGIGSVVYSPDSRHLASGSDNCTVRLWDAVTGTCLQTLEGHTDEISSVVYSPDSRQLASGSYDSTVRLWDTVTGTCLQTLEGHTDMIDLVVYSPDSRHLTSGSDDGTVRLWDAVTGTCLQTLKGHTDWFAFGSDGSTLVTKFGPLSLKHSSQFDYARRPEEYGILNEAKWITRNDSKLLWVPPEYRPNVFAVKGNRIGIGCLSGLVYILNFLPQ